jgi:hypothetical protein
MHSYIDRITSVESNGPAKPPTGTPIRPYPRGRAHTPGGSGTGRELTPLPFSAFHLTWHPWPGQNRQHGTDELPWGRKKKHVCGAGGVKTPTALCYDTITLFSDHTLISNTV